MAADAAADTAPPRAVRLWGLAAGFVLAFGLQLFPPPEGLAPEGWVVASLALLMCAWWGTEAIPLPATALLPLVVLPLTGVAPLRDAGVHYMSPIVLLFLGGFILALTLEKWRVHARIALNIVVRAGGRPRALILGFLIATAFLSMWISNTATTLMMIPIAIAVAEAETGARDARNPFAAALILAVPYAASIGGMGTPVGTPTNLIAINYLTEAAGRSVSFMQWMVIGIPVVVLMLPLAWVVLTRVSLKVDARAQGAAEAEVRGRLKALGRVSPPEARIALLFGAVAILWIVREPLVTWLAPPHIQALDGTEIDAAIALLGAVLAFLIPAGGERGEGKALTDWETAVRLPWGAILLFGGGLSLAAAMGKTGLAAWLGAQMAGLSILPALAMVLILVLLLVFLTELMSNVAMITTFMPVIAALALAGGIDIMTLAIPAAIAASCGFMLPAGTAPNAIAYGTGVISMNQMLRAGFWIDIGGAVLIALLAFALGPLIF